MENVKAEKEKELVIPLKKRLLFVVFTIAEGLMQL